jgi:hypothetical protein
MNATQHGLLGKRRSFLVNRRYQLRASLLTAAVVLVLLVLLNLAIYASTMRGAERVLVDAPELAEVIRAQDRAQLYLILLASLVYLIGVFLVTVLETHRTAGAAFNLEARLGEVRRGRYDTRLKLRRGDNLAELEGTFNGMVEALRQRTWDDIEHLVQLANEAGKIADASGGRQLAERLRRLADEKRSRLE